VYKLTESNAALTCCAHDSAFGGAIVRAVVLNCAEQWMRAGGHRLCVTLCAMLPTMVLSIVSNTPSHANSRNRGAMPDGEKKAMLGLYSVQCWL
jgi:hypothetical protein